MSSWYFSSAPSVSPTICGVSERASSSVSAVADLDHLQRLQRIDDSTGPDRNPGSAPRAGKADHVVGHLAGRGIEVIDGHRTHSHSGARAARTRNPEIVCARFRVRRCATPRNDNYSLVASFKTFCKPSPCIRAMSSWYFSSAPRVSPTTCGVSDLASSSVSAVAQSMVSATPGDL